MTALASDPHSGSRASRVPPQTVSDAAHPPNVSLRAFQELRFFANLNLKKDSLFRKFKAKKTKTKTQEKI